jgi:flagellar biosynthesis/type III secretory pathway protein FliH
VRATWFEKGEAKGEAKGLEQGQRKMLEILLEQQFGALSPRVQEKLQSLSAERLEELARALLRAKSLEELGLAD